ncbi:MAG: ATP-binding protein, partial [Terriglobales bacterium]
VEIRNAATRAASLTRQLLAFSRQQVLAPKVMDLNEVTRGMENMLQRLLGEDIELALSLHSGLGHIKADPGQISQVIMNLAVNARDAMPRGGRLTVVTSNVTLTEPYADESFSIPAGAYVSLTVTDTGVGMEAEVVSHIFEPFFTTKLHEKGTGLGLATVYGIVKQSGGNILVHSEVGRGSTCRIYLPQVEEPLEPLTPRRSERLGYAGSETVLLVEDEDAVREFTKQVLLRHGYTVLEARNGVEALSVSQHASHPIDLLLTDVIMQQMGGQELAGRLLELHPNLRVLFMSGYIQDAEQNLGQLFSNASFLQKPFSSEALVQEVREVLDSPVAAARPGVTGG